MWWWALTQTFPTGYGKGSQNTKEEEIVYTTSAVNWNLKFVPWGKKVPYGETSFLTKISRYLLTDVMQS